MKNFSIYILFFCVLLANRAFSQNSRDANVTVMIISHELDDLEYKQLTKRKFLDLSNSSIFQKINPLTYVGAGLLFFYQRVISEQISADCSYETSCSETAKRAIEKYGLIKGALIGVNQLSSCVPGNHHEHPEHLINKKGKIINDL